MPRKTQTGNGQSTTSLKHDFELYTIDQVAKLLERHKETVLRYIREDKLNARKAAGKWLVHKSDLDKFFGLTTAMTKKK